MRKIIFGLCAILLTISLYADKITLNDGSILNGEIQGIADGKVTIKTAFAGELAIPVASIASLDSAKQFGVATADGQKALNASLNDKQLGQVKVAWPAGAPDPTLPKGRTWNGEISMDLNGKTGNSEKCRLGLGAKATMQGPDDKLLIYGVLNKAKDSGEYTEDEIIGGLDYEYRIAQSKNAIYAKFEAEKDKIAELKLRTQYSAGYGFYFIDEKDMSLRLRIGGNYERKKYEDGDVQESTGVELGLHFEKDIDAWGKWTTDVTYAPDLRNFNHYRIFHETALDIPMLVKVPLTLRLGVSNEYNNPVPEETDHLDTTYFVKLVYRWK